MAPRAMPDPVRNTLRSRPCTPSLPVPWDSKPARAAFLARICGEHAIMPVFLALVASSQSCHALRIGNTLPAHAMARTMIPKMAPCVGISAAMPMPALTPRLAPRMHAPIVPDILFPWFWNAQMMQEPQETVPKENHSLIRAETVQCVCETWGMGSVVLGYQPDVSA